MAKCFATEGGGEGRGGGGGGSGLLIVGFLREVVVMGGVVFWGEMWVVF